MSAEIEWLLRKLQPLLPAETTRWRKLRRQVDAGTLSLLDEQIHRTAAQHLGEHSESGILLSLPPQGLIDGPIGVGDFQYARKHARCGIGLSDVLNHISIFGRSGAGKTNLVFHLLEQLAKQGIPFLFLDWKRTARHWIGGMDAQRSLAQRIPIYTPGRSLSPLAFNPFTPPPALEPETYANHVVDCLAEAYDLGDGAISILHKTITDIYTRGNLYPTASEILELIQSRPIKGRAIGWSQSAVRALKSVEALSLGESAGMSPAALAESLLNQSTVIELDGLPASARRFLIPMLCLFLYSQQLAVPQRERLQLVIVVEEAHHLFLREQHRARESILSVIARQAREVGLAFMWVDQHPHLIASSALGNSAVTVFLNLKDPADVSKAAAVCGMADEHDKRCFTLLPVGHAVVKLQNRWREPFLVKIPHISLKKGEVSDAQVHEWAERGPLLTGREASMSSGGPAARARNTSERDLGDREVVTEVTRPSAKSTPSLVISGADSGLSRGIPADSGAMRGIHGQDEEAAFAPADALALLEDVAAFALDGVGARYRRLRMSGLRGNRAKEWLVSQVLAEVQSVEIGLTRKVILRPTPTGWRMVGREAPAWTGLGIGGGPGRASIEHEYWQRWYAHKLQAAGWKVDYEGLLRAGGRADLLASRLGARNESIAVEIETGKSDVCANVRACLEDDFAQIVVIATTRSACRQVERALERAGLMSARVTLLTAPAPIPFLGTSRNATA